MDELIEKNPSKLKVSYLVPYLIITILIPVAKLHIRVFHNEDMKQVLLHTQWFDDYFCLIKVLLLYLAVILLFIVFIFQKNLDNKFPKILYFLVPYCICLLLSMYFSEYKISALFGIIDMYEGGLTQLCYCCILLFSYYLFSDSEKMVAILKMALTASIPVSIIGILEFTGILPLEKPFAISSTIGNPNYVGTYGAVLLPLAMMLVLIETDGAKRIICLLLFFGSAFFLTAGSMSRAGYLAVFVTFPLFFVLFLRISKEQIKWFIAFISYGLCIFLLMNACGDGVLWEEIKSMNPFESTADRNRLIFKDIKLKDSSATIETNRWFIRLENNGDGFRLYNEKSEEIRFQRDDNIIKFSDEPYSGITGYVVESPEFSWLMLETEGKDIEFVLTNGEMKVVGYNGKVTGISPVESFGFKGKESFASGRGYIWSRAIPLLKKATFIGYGPDTFTYIFPQNDIVGKLNYGAIWVIIGKPHNWYLQIALGSGVFSLVCLMVIIIWYIVKTLGVVTKNYNNEEIPIKNNSKADEVKRNQTVALGVLMSVIAYCITGVFNDSTVAVSPLFWMLLGFGISLIQKRNHLAQ